MKFRDFSKNLSSEIENLFATLGDASLPEEAHRLDQSFSIQEILERVKNMDTTNNQTDTKPAKPIS